MMGRIRAVDQVDALRTFRERRVFPASGKIEVQAGSRLISGFELSAFHVRIEIVVDRRAVDDLRDLIAFVFVIEDIAVQRHGTVEKRVLAAQFECIDEFGLEGKRMDRVRTEALPVTAQYHRTMLPADWRRPLCSRASRKHRRASDR